MTTADVGVETRRYINSYIAFADAKAGAVVALLAAIGTAIGFAANEFFSFIRTAGAAWSLVALFVAACVAICAVMTLLRAIEALTPRTPAAGASLASFPDIAKVPVEQFVAAAIRLDDEGFARELAVHNATLSRIAVEKFGCVAAALWWLRGLLFGAYVLIVIYGYRVASLAPKGP